MITKNFSSERDPHCVNLKKRLDEFYSTTDDYTAFHQPNSHPQFWDHIKNTIQMFVQDQGNCQVLEFGSGCTSFGKYLSDLRSKVIFHVQDVTTTNQEYLSTQADHVFISDVTEIHEKYDVIFSTFVWEHLTNPQKTLTHLLSILNPGGSIFLVSPRYDFPFYLSPSAKHLSKTERLWLSIWLVWRRVKVLLGEDPSFIIHTDPAVFHRQWFRDSDAIHWVSYYDLIRYLPSEINLKRIRIKSSGIKGKFWESCLLLFVQISRPLP